MTESNPDISSLSSRQDEMQMYVYIQHIWMDVK